MKPPFHAPAPSLTTRAPSRRAIPSMAPQMNRWLSGFLMLVIAAGCDQADNQSRSNQPGPPAGRHRGFWAEGQANPPELDGQELPAEAGQPAPVFHKHDADAILTNATLLQIDIEIPRAGISALRRTHWGNGAQRPIARATVREGGFTYNKVAVHLKGAAGSFRSIDDRPALTLTFDKFVPGQSFHGLHKISLNNSVQDPTYLCEKISRELFIAAGVPVPRAAHALVRLNRRDLGLYVLLEGANKQFLKRYFGNASGNLYDGGFCQDISPSLEVNCGDDPKNNLRLRALCAAVRQRPDFARLEKVLDVPRFVSMVALEMMLCHWDGYSLNRNNWRIFHDLESDRMVFIPHGLDQLFQLGGQFNPGDPIMPKNAQGSVTRALLATREGQTLYRERFGQLYTNVFDPQAIGRRLDAIAAGLRSALADSNPGLGESIQRQADALKRRIRRRAEDLGRQLTPPPPALEFARDHPVPLTGWTSFLLSGSPAFSQTQDPDGRNLLVINAGNELSSSSWRTRVTLRAGRYQFKGRLRLHGVAVEQGDTRGGAGLRVSKQMPTKLTGTTPWTDYTFPFSLPRDGEVELICELRALKGEVWFDAASLSLVRLP
jgi:spore coat protein H